MTYTNDLMTSATDNFGNNYSYVYDSLGHITQATDPVGRVTTYTYDIKSDSLHSTFLTSVTDAGGTTAISWNEGGPSGVGYFSDSCVSTYCEPAIGVNTIAYPDGTHSYYTYDALGRLASTYRDGKTENITYSYGSGGVVTKTDANGNVSRSILNEFGDLLQYVDPLGSVLKIAYDPENKVTGLLEPLGANTSIGYDSQGNVSSSIDPLGNQQSQSFAPYNNLQSYTSPSGNLLQFNYDSHYNPVAAVYPDGTATHATYDSAGNLTSFTNRRGHTITYVYNAQNLLIAKTYSSGPQLAFTYDAHRNLATVSAANGMTSYTYDSADRPTGISFPNGQSIQYTYNSGGQRSSMTDSTGFSVKYTYDAAGRLSQLSSGSGSSIVSYAYDASGRLSSKTLGNGVLTSYTYDGTGNLLRIANSSPGGGTISQFDYTYDAFGRRTTTNAAAGAGSYGYDADGEVTSATLPGGTAAYTFDADGNRTAGSGLSYSVNNLDQYTSAGTANYSYDADGNLTSGAGWTYTYDDDNRLISMFDATDTWTYQYDGLGNRVSATHNGITTQYLNDLSGDGNVEAELTASGQVITHFTYGLDLTSSIPASGSPAYYHFDGAGNTVQMTNSSGTVVNSYSYLPFGEKLASTAGVFNPFTYVGEYGVMDDGSGLYFMRNRSYSPVLGRFVQLDPLGLAGGSANLYNYTGNNPITQVDPLGTEDEPTRDLLNQTFNQVNHTNVDTVDSTATRQATQDRVINGAKEQAVETIVTIAAPEVEISENKVLTFAFNKYFPHKLLEKGIDHSLGIKEPEEPSEPGSEEPGHKSEPPSSSHPGDLVPPATPGDSKTDPSEASKDPNGKLTSGYGDQGFVPPNTPILYTIYFENQSTATAAAEEVTVTDPLAANLDWSTVQLNQIQFNNITIDVPAGQQTYTGQVNVRTDPNPVSVNAALNPSTGVLSWTMQSVNPTTGGLPSDPLAGFLPPNNASNQGTGYVTFTVKPKSGLSNGTAITNQASIVFDANAAISTNIVTNTIDSVDPTSSVGALPATTTSPSFTVTWSGSDPAGAGIASYNIFVSINNGAYSVWQASTTATSATYSGVAGLTYSFYSIATDNAGNIQLAPGPIQTTTITAQALASQTITFGPLANQTYGVAAISLIATASSGLPVAYTVTGPATVSGSTLTITGAGLVTVTASQAGNNAYAAATSVSQSFTIAKATLTATATNVTRLYGAANPALTYSLAGFVNGDTSAVVSGSATLSTTAATTSAPGPYPITFAIEALAATNYIFNYVAGELTVSGGAYQTITFSALLNQTYGTAPFTLAATASSGLPVSYRVNGPAAISGSILTVTGAGLVTVTASQAGNADYAAATPVSQSFTVAKAVLTAAAASLSRIYGVANPALTYSVAGFVNGDTIAIVSGSATLSTTASATSSAGTYPITFTTEALAATNYSFNYVAGVLTISGGASQTISFGPLVGKTYGVAPLTLTATASSGLPVSYTTTGPATVSGSTLTITGAGLVIVTASQTGNTHYAAAMPVSQSLTVAKAVLTATAASVSRPYGAANPALTYSVAGFVKGDKTSVVSGSATPTTTATATSAPGTYPITFATEGLVAANYSFTYVAGTLTVSSGTLAIAPSSWNFGSVTVGRIRACSHY
jgi:RHS repeat-associated protein